MLFEQVDVKTLLEKDLPQSVRSHFVPAVKRAYDLVAKLYEQHQFLSWPVGYEHRRELRRIAVEYELMKLVDSGQIPLEYQIGYNAIRNCRHLELLTKQFIITVSQVQYPRSFPRPAIFRNRLLSGQLAWDFFGESEKLITGRFYIILTHGYEKHYPEFICLGVPDPDQKGRWITQIDLLKETPTVELPEEEIITEGTLLKFKEFVKEAVGNGR
ncbi:hypothetical protein G7K71_13810 [Desulfofundulus sp. TPOSR]|uniref:hypothetical protein n=1 Tax=Desulfofundulus sp. TPOSR TaxID=2714340 RepID=UPI00140E1236|nr:hypothetical protein [Desulfofundulus sp. TPOSR]NHM28033.1 hypothetical protein [Desulfofundulus sp. TPOSR]